MQRWHTRQGHQQGPLCSRSAGPLGVLSRRHCQRQAPRQCLQLPAAAAGPSWQQWLGQCSRFHASDAATQRADHLQQQLQHKLSRTYAAEVERVKTRLDGLQLMQQMGPEDDAAAEAIAANKQTLKQLQAAPDPTALIPDASARVLQLQLQLQQLAASDPLAAARATLAAALEEEDYTAAAAAAAEGATWLEGWWVGSRLQQQPQQDAQHEKQQEGSKDAVRSTGSSLGDSGATPDPQGHLLHVTVEHGRWVGRTYTADTLAKVAGFLDDNPLGISIQTVRFGSDPEVIISGLGRPLGPPPWRLGVVEGEAVQRTLSSEGCPVFELYTPPGAASSGTSSSESSSSSSPPDVVGLQQAAAQSSSVSGGVGCEGTNGLAAVRLLGAPECITLAAAPPQSVLQQHLAASSAAATAAAVDSTPATATTASIDGSSSGITTSSKPSAAHSSSSSAGSPVLSPPPCKGVVTVYVEFGATTAADGREVVRVGMLAQQLGLHRVWDLEVRPAAPPAAPAPAGTSSSSSSTSATSSAAAAAAAAADFFSLEPPDKPLCRLAMHGDNAEALLASTLTSSTITGSISSGTAAADGSTDSSSSTGGESGTVSGLFRSQERPVEFSPCVVKSLQQRLPASLCRQGQDGFVLQDLWPPLQQLSPVAKQPSGTSSSSTLNTADSTTSSSSSSSRDSSSRVAGIYAAIAAAEHARPFTWQPSPSATHPPPVLTLHLPLRDIDPDGQPPPRARPWEPVHPSQEEVAAYKALKALRGTSNKQPSQLLGGGAAWQQLAEAASSLYQQETGRQLPVEVVGQVAAQVCRYVGDDLEPQGLAPHLPHHPQQQQQQQQQEEGEGGSGQQLALQQEEGYGRDQQPQQQQQQEEEEEQEAEGMGESVQQQQQQQQPSLISRWQVLPADYTPPPAAVHYRRLQLLLPSAAGVKEDPLTGIFIGAFGTQGRQLLQLRRHTTPSGQPLVIATKLTGDSRLPAGGEVFRARVGPGQALGLEGEGGEAEYPPELGATARYPGEGCIAAGAGQPQVWVPGELVVVAPSPDVPALQGATLGLRWAVAGGKQYMSLLNRLHLDQLA